MTMSYAHGPSDIPLLGETIGENLRRTVERIGERDALVVGHQRLPGHGAPGGALARGRQRSARPARPRGPQGQQHQDVDSSTATSGW